MMLLLMDNMVGMWCRKLALPRLLRSMFLTIVVTPFSKRPSHVANVLLRINSFISIPQSSQCTAPPIDERCETKTALGLSPRTVTARPAAKQTVPESFMLCS